MSIALKDFRSAARAAGERIEYIWDWPNVPGKQYSVKDREKLRSLSTYFTALTSVTGAAVCIALQCYKPAVVIPVATFAAIGGHYMAGVFFEVTRSKNKSPPEPKL